MAGVKTLLKDTVIYGVSNMLGKFLNWLLVPLYTYVLVAQSDYGIITNLYAWSALAIVILTFGLETTYFRFANREGYDPAKTYGAATSIVALLALLFALVCISFANPIATALQYPGHADFIAIMATIMAMDAFNNIPFVYLRNNKKSVTFALLKFAGVVINIAANLFFLVLCPHITDWSIIGSWWQESHQVRYVLISNLFSTIFTTLALLPYLRRADFRIPRSLLKQMLSYSWPLVILGIAGIMNQTLDRIIFPYLYTEPDAQAQLGIYGACFKVSMVMMMFTQAFRYAYEPFVFGKHKDHHGDEAMADGTKFYIIFAWFIFLIMVFYVDILGLLIQKDYRVGLKVVPIVLLAYIFQGVFFNLSMWYKMDNDDRKTLYGALISIIGLVITIAINVIFVPKYGYMASATASLVCFVVVTLISYFWGRKYRNVPYDLKRIAIYSLVALCMYGVTLGVDRLQYGTIFNYTYKTLLLFVYIAIVLKFDLPVSQIPLLNKIIKKIRK